MRLSRSASFWYSLNSQPRQHVTQEEHDPEHLMRLDATRDDALRELASVRLEGLDAPGLQGVDVVVVDLGRLGEDLLVGHDPQELGVADAPRPLLAKFGAVVAQVGDELLQVGAVLAGLLGRLAPGSIVLRARGRPRSAS